MPERLDADPAEKQATQWSSPPVRTIGPTATTAC
jgi:hypothetical protein